MELLTVTDATFDAQVRQSDIPVLVEFGSQWCAPCKQLEPALHDISIALAGQIKIVKVDLEQNPTTASQLGVRGMPAMFLFKNGRIVANKTGNAPKTVVQAWIETTLAEAALA